MWSSAGRDEEVGVVGAEGEDWTEARGDELVSGRSNPNRIGARPCPGARDTSALVAEAGRG